jgi:vacuolar-type H+-ATPase subunit H
MAPRIIQRKRHLEDEDQLEPTFDGVPSLGSSSDVAAAGLPEPSPTHEEEPGQEISKEMRTAIDLPGVKIVQAARIERDQIISAANLAADRTREDGRKNAAMRREETIANARAAAEKGRLAINEKAKKEALAFKSRKKQSVPKVAAAVFSKVFDDMF